MEISSIVWLAVLVGFAILEGVTAAVVSIWFCIGAVAALIISLIWPSAVAVQVIAFFIVSAIALMALRPFVRRMIGNKHVATNADASIGKNCQVVSEVQPGHFGRVKLEGMEWRAKSAYVMPVGSWGRVEAIEGATLVVTPLA